MTDRLIRSVAKEMASVFYTEASKEYGSAIHDQQRSKSFRETYPTLRHYIRGMQVKKDGTINIDRPGWLFFVVPARQRLVQMLTDPSVSDHKKEAIMASLINEHNKATSPKAVSLLQRRMGDKVTFSQ
jgi:hypothetical protein